MAGAAVFYYDFNSPYAYLAAERIDELVPGAEWRPIAFPILLAMRGALEEKLREVDPESTAAEAAARLADRGMPPFRPPPGWPRETWSLAPARAALVADEQGLIREFTRAAFRKSFVEGHTLTDMDDLLAAARDAGLEPDGVAEAIRRQEIKDRLKRHTEEAVERGVTGIPTVAIGDELFWGDDRLEEAAAAAATPA